MAVLRLRSIEDTTLWKRLTSGFRDSTWGSLATSLSASLIDICREAGDRMKAVPINMPQYTLHDEVHLLRVTELMSMVLGRVIDNLNPIEISLLILSAHFHDHGMVLSSKEVAGLETDKDFLLRRDNWIIDHPNLSEIQKQLTRQDLSEQERIRLRVQETDLQRAMLTDYIRETHAQRSRAFVKQEYTTDPRWTTLGTNLADIVGKLCESHGQPVDWMSSRNGFHDDRSVGIAQVNMRYLGLILRLADILDLDRDRTPDLLYRAIHFTNEVSVAEWEKHRAVEGWTISPSQIRFTMEFTHPAYERTARRFMDWIDEELAASHAVVKSFPGPIAKDYPLELPERVTRDRLGPKDNCYRYHELEFSLSRDEIVKLLMTDKLYGEPSLAIRELMQNSLDALRYRRALHAREGSTCSAGFVRLEHDVDANGHEVLRCIDNGVGMDEAIITRFLTRAGRSFYRSPQFEQERISFKAAKVDFDPCARFGIGFMSCFMLGDHIIVKTRRDRGPQGGYGEPLVVEINGLGGILVIRQGPHDQPVGTTVEITGRRKPAFLDGWEDRVNLIAIVDGYALATEFPIEARCMVPEIKGSLQVPDQAAIRKTLTERASLTKTMTLRQDFSQIDRRLGGEIRVGLLKDASGCPALSSEEATWIPEGASHSGHHLRLANGTVVGERESHRNGSVCIDGILVCGQPGRKLGRYEGRLGWRAEVVGMPFPYVIDIRGNIKPILTPARVPPERGSGLAPSWRRIQKLMWLAEGRLWEQVAAYLSRGMSNETFWELTELHAVSPHLMTFGTIWSKVAVPLADPSGTTEWVKLSTIARLTVEGEASRALCDPNGRRLTHHRGMDRWIRPNRGQDPDEKMRTLVVLMSTLVLEGNRPEFALLPPRDPNRSPCEFLMNAFFGFREYPIPFGAGLADALAACTPIQCVNREHPLVLEAIESEMVEEPSPLQIFGRGCVTWLSARSTAELIGTKAANKLGRGLKWLGHQYRSIDWSRVAKELHPPYKIWCEPYGLMEVEERHFLAWADGQSVEDEDIEDEGDE